MLTLLLADVLGEVALVAVRAVPAVGAADVLADAFVLIAVLRRRTRVQVACDLASRGAGGPWLGFFAARGGRGRSPRVAGPVTARDEKRDRRRVFVSLTARGRALAEKLERCADDYSERILKRIPAEMREDMIHTLRVLIEAIDDLPAACS